MKRFLTLAVLLFVYVNAAMPIFAHEEELEFFHPVKIEKDKPLSITDCISLAYQNSPKIKRQKYNLDIAKSRLGIARAGYFPVISAGVGIYNEYNSDSVYYDKHYRDLPSVGVSINKLVWDFGKTTANIKMEKFYKIGAEYEFMDSLCGTLFEVKQKYYALLKTKAVRDIALENVKMQTEIIKMMEGKHPDWDNAGGVMSANKIQYIAAEEAYKTAKVNLNNVMYLDKKTDFDIENTDTFKYTVPNDIEKWKIEYGIHKNHVFPFKREDATSLAYKNSPDLHVLIATKKAMQQSLNYIKRTYLPEINANVGYGYNNTFNASNNSLRVGVTMDAGINLMELHHSIKGADAQLSLAQNEIDLFKKDLYYEIQRAFNNLDMIEEQLPLARGNVFFALNTYTIAVDKYKNNQVDYVAVQDAKLDYINSNIAYAEKLYEYNMALIQLEMAMHCHIVDIHHKSGHAVHHHSEELISDLIKALECNKTEDNAKRKSLLFGKDTDIEDDEDL